MSLNLICLNLLFDTVTLNQSVLWEEKTQKKEET